MMSNELDEIYSVIEDKQNETLSNIRLLHEMVLSHRLMSDEQYHETVLKPYVDAMDNLNDNSVDHLEILGDTKQTLEDMWKRMRDETIESWKAIKERLEEDGL